MHCKLYCTISIFVISILKGFYAYAGPTWQCLEPEYRVQYPVKDFYAHLHKIESYVEEGYSLASKLIRHRGLKQQEFYALFLQSKNKKLIQSLKAGTRIVTYLAKESCRFIESRIELTHNRELRIFKKEGRLVDQVYQFPIRYHTAYEKFTIKHSLFVDGNAVGISDRVLSNVESLLAGKVNFSKVLSQGDRFRILYEKLYNAENDFLRSGAILWVEYRRKNGRVYQVGNYTSTQGQICYLDEKKQNLESLFIRNPVKYTRISSGFSSRRKHPVLHVFRRHKGVDFAAPKGTPIRAVGAGVVKKKYYSKSYGNVIFIQHGKRYTTVYAHMSRFAPSINEGTKVSRAQVIGYVGSTGLATGPHLHYEFRIDNKHYNPQTVKLPRSIHRAGCKVTDSTYQRQHALLMRKVIDLDKGAIY